MRLLALLPLLLCSCAPLVGSHTAIYGPNGKLAFETNSDSLMLNVALIGIGTITTRGMTHSGVVKARGDAYSQFITAAGNATGQGARAFIKP